MRPQGPSRLPRGPSYAPQPDFTPSMNLSRAFDLAGRRDSDVSSLCSSLPSSAGGRPVNPILSDRSSQSSALSYVNSYLSSLNAPFTLRPPLPSAKDIVSALRYLLSRLDYDVAPSDKALEEELLAFLRMNKCPFKLTRSALKAPGTPHAWPPILSVLFWLTQLASVHDHSSQSEPAYLPNDLDSYLNKCYCHFLAAEDETIEHLDEEYVSNVRAHRVSTVEHLEELEKTVIDREANLSAMTQGGSAREELEKKRDLLKGDVKKFQEVVESWEGRVQEMKEALTGLQRELEEKEKVTKRCLEERSELERRIGEQGVNVRDVERMRREMQSVERDIEEAVNRKNLIEEQAWEVEAGVVKILDELELLVEKANQDLRKLKVEVQFQYVLNANGPTPCDMIGANYKNILKPVLKTLDEDLKKSSVSKIEESISLQKDLQNKLNLVEEKNKHLTNFQDKLNEIETKLVSFKTQIQKNKSKCTAEADRLKDEMTQKENELAIVETKANEFLKMCEKEKENAIREIEEKTQFCSKQLLEFIDLLSGHKEYMESLVQKSNSNFSLMTDDLASMSKNMVSSCVSRAKRARSCRN